MPAMFVHLLFPLFIGLLFSSFQNVIACYLWPLPDGFPPGSRALIRGTPHANVSQYGNRTYWVIVFTSFSFHKFFAINFLTYTPSISSGDIAFHISARFGEGAIVTNSYILGKSWQEQLSYKDSPFQGGRPFEIMILSETNQFSVYINDYHFLDFAHRLPFDKIGYLQVAESVTLSSITVDKVLFYSWALKDGFPLNQMVTIQGTPTIRNFNREFSINLQNCPLIRKDCYIALKMLVQYGKRIVINNSYQKGLGWGQPEVQTNLPIELDKAFSIAISNKVDHFKIYINNKEYCTFRHRNPESDITHVVLRDTLDVSTIAISSG